jgi:uncharacterized membrane protein HdeD (DUF308 family)
MRVSVAVIDVETLVQNWWAIALRGALGVLFGIITFIAPGISLTALVLLFGAYAFVDGIFALVAAVRRHGGKRWWLLLLQGIAGIGAGLITLFWPAITALALLAVVAAWALVTGGFEIAAAIRLRKAITGEWLLALSGIASVVLGVLLMLFPGPGTLALVLWIGAYAFVSGVLLIALGIRLRSWGKSHAPGAAHAAASA